MPNRFIITELPVTDAFLREKRLIQDRGELALIEDGLRMDHLGYFSLNPGPGLFRGGHFHRVKTEHFYVVNGRARVDLADPETGETWSVILDAGAKARVLPGLAHRFHALEPLQVIEYYEGAYDPRDDVPYTGFGDHTGLGK